MKNQLNYKEYTGTIEFDEHRKLFIGKVIGTSKSLTYCGASADELINSFHKTIDTYLMNCREAGKEPEHPFKGSFNVRVSPCTHKQASEFAANHDVSLNTLVNQALRYYLAGHKKDDC
jgi:predicted HicB family RNase H-like nuclease